MTTKTGYNVSDIPWKIEWWKLYPCPYSSLWNRRKEIFQIDIKDIMMSNMHTCIGYNRSPLSKSHCGFTRRINRLKNYVKHVKQNAQLVAWCIYFSNTTAFFLI